MATVGFEMEFTEFKVDLGPNPNLKGTDLFIIIDERGDDIFRVTPDNYQKKSQTYDTLEVITKDPISDFNTLNFTPLDTFIDRLKKIMYDEGVTRITFDICSLSSKKYSSLKIYCRYVYSGSVTIIFQPAGWQNASLRELLSLPCLVGLQMTFGFSADYLPNFYKHFEVEKYGRSDFLLCFIEDLQPYSESSMQKFCTKFTLMSASPSISNKQFLQLFYVLELVKAYIAYASDNSTQKTRNINSAADLGYKDYYGCIMSRTAFSSMLQFLSIDFSEELQTVIKAYIRECFRNPNLQLFIELYQNGTIGIPPKKYMVREEIINATKAVLTLDNILDSLFPTRQVLNFRVKCSAVDIEIIVDFMHDSVPLPLPSDIVSMLKLFNDIISDKALADPRWKDYLQEQVTINSNALFYDLFSPVPLSPSEDPMGRYSRPPHNMKIPLIEVRNMNKLYLESSDDQRIREIKEITHNSNARPTCNDPYYCNTLKHFIRYQCEAAFDHWPSSQ